MTAAEWGSLIPAVVGLIVAITALIRAKLTDTKVNTVSSAVQAHIEKTLYTTPPGDSASDKLN